MELTYYTLDVFTDRIFGGNPLAVVVDAPELSGELMQRITREFNYSETVFVLPPAGPGAHRRVRIFTPGRELPFAGHPTIGTALLLAELGVGPGGEIVLEEPVGNVRVTISRSPSGPAYAELTVPGKPELRTVATTPDVIASVVGLSPGDLAVPGEGLTAASCGVPFVMVPVQSAATLARAEASTAKWREHLADQWARELYLFWEEPDGIRARMFAPGMGIPEDPATGAAAAALAAWLAAGGPDGDHRRTIQQGVEMGRPSTLQISWEKQDGEIRAVRVGGTAVRVASGTLTVSREPG